MLCEGGEAYLVLSVLGEEARGDQPDDYAAQQRHDDEYCSNIDLHFSSLGETTARVDSHLVAKLNL